MAARWRCRPHPGLPHSLGWGGRWSEGRGRLPEEAVLLGLLHLLTPGRGEAHCTWPWPWPSCQLPHQESHPNPSPWHTGSAHPSLTPGPYHLLASSLEGHSPGCPLCWHPGLCSEAHPTPPAHRLASPTPGSIFVFACSSEFISPKSTGHLRADPPEKPSPGRCSGALPGWHCGPDDTATWVQRPETGRGWASGGPSGLEGPREEGTGTPQAQPCCGPVFLWPPEPSRESGSPPEGGKVRAPRGPGDLARGPGQRGYPPAGGRSRNPPSSPPRCSRTAPLASPGR